MAVIEVAAITSILKGIAAFLQGVLWVLQRYSKALEHREFTEEHVARQFYRGYGLNQWLG